MVEVRLHGELAAEFGRVWHLDIRSPREAAQAIQANTKRFFAKIKELERRGMVFRVRTKTHDYDSTDVGASLGNSKRMDIIPLIVGASAGVRFVIGAALVIVGAYTTVFGGYGTYAISAGIAMMIGSVAEWLTPVPKRPEDVTKNLQSWTLSGPTNTVDQGTPVPVIYGEVLTGGYTISAGISAAQLGPGDSIAPMVTIGGELDLGVATAGTGTFVFMLSAGQFNLDEPYAYAWSYTGFDNASAVRMIGNTSATVRIEVDYPGDGVYEGNVTLTTTGRTSGTALSGTPTTVSLSTTKAVRGTVATYSLTPVDSGGGGS